MDDKDRSQLHHITTMPRSHGTATDQNCPSTFHPRDLYYTEQSSTWCLHSLKTGCTWLWCSKNTTVAPAIPVSTVLGVSSPCISLYWSTHNQEPSFNQVNGVIENLCVIASSSPLLWLLESRNYHPFNE